MGQIAGYSGGSGARAPEADGITRPPDTWWGIDGLVQLQFSLNTVERDVLFSPRWRRVVLIAHIASSVGWFGAVVVFLVLATLGIRSGGEPLMNAIYVALPAVGWFVIVPFSAASLLTGLIQSAGTRWGFVRHYWVLSKLLITVGAGILLLLHMRVMDAVAHTAAAGPLPAGHLRDQRMRLVGDAAAALVVLAIALVLSVFKPEGRLTRFRTPPAGLKKWTPMAYGFWAGLAIIVIALALRHVSGGLPQH